MPKRKRIPVDRNSREHATLPLEVEIIIIKHACHNARGDHQRIVTMEAVNKTWLREVRRISLVGQVVLLNAFDFVGFLHLLSIRGYEETEFEISKASVSVTRLLSDTACVTGRFDLSTSVGVRVVPSRRFCLNIGDIDSLIRFARHDNKQGEDNVRLSLELYAGEDVVRVKASRGDVLFTPCVPTWYDEDGESLISILPVGCSPPLITRDYDHQCWGMIFFNEIDRETVSTLTIVPSEPNILTIDTEWPDSGMSHQMKITLDENTPTRTEPYEKTVSTADLLTVPGRLLKASESRQAQLGVLIGDESPFAWIVTLPCVIIEYYFTP